MTVLSEDYVARSLHQLPLHCVPGDSKATIIALRRTEGYGGIRSEVGPILLELL